MDLAQILLSKISFLTLSRTHISEITTGNAYPIRLMPLSNGLYPITCPATYYAIYYISKGSSSWYFSATLPFNTIWTFSSSQNTISFILFSTTYKWGINFKNYRLV